MTAPKQEKWINKWLPQLNIKICQGIGGTLDTIVGTVKRAPAEELDELGRKVTIRIDVSAA